MSILISGSVAFDTIIQTVGNFREQDANIESLHLSLFSPQIRKEYGGTAANIAYTLTLLGKHPHIIASIGEDGIEYRGRLHEIGIHTELINTVPDSYCPQAYIIRDECNGQITTFHPGAMSTSWELTHGNIAFDFVIVAPDSREGMIRRVRECTHAGIFTIFDPGQAMGIFSKEELEELTNKADITIMNEPEREQFRNMTGIDFVTLCTDFWHMAIVTLWYKWAFIKSEMIEIWIPSIYASSIVDATGCGDAFRSGLLYGLSEGWNLEKSCQLGNMLGGIKIGYIGGQNHIFDTIQLNEIGEKEYGVKFFDS